MNTLIQSFFIILIFLFGCSETNIPDIELPEKVNLGETKVYLNGQLEDYKPKFFEDTVNHQLLLTFKFEPDFSVSNSLGFSALPIKSGNYILHEERILFKGAKSSFNQTVESEYDGWQYKLVRPEEGYFDIEELDTINQTIQGKFKAYFEVKEKNGYPNMKLPEKAKFEGVYHEKYIRN